MHIKCDFCGGPAYWCCGPSGEVYYSCAAVCPEFATIDMFSGEPFPTVPRSEPGPTPSTDHPSPATADPAQLDLLSDTLPF